MIVMIGTAPSTMGGISSVVRVLKEGGLFNQYHIRYVSTHSDGSGVRKLFMAVAGLGHFLALIARETVALAHIHLSSNMSFWRKFIYFLIARTCRIPVVTHLHGAEFDVFYQNGRPYTTQKAIRYLFEGSKTVITLSRSWHAWVRTQFPKARSVVVPNPIIMPPPVSASSRDKATLLFLGRLGKRKGTYDLIDALPELITGHPELKLLLCGDGDLDGARNHAVARGVSPNVEILGWVHKEEKHQLLKRATVLVLPSYNEGLPMSVLEAMSYGLPIVATPVGGIPEAVTDGTEGFLVTPGDVKTLGDRLAVLIDDSALRESMGEAARRKAELTFSVSGTLRLLQQIYTDTVGAVPTCNPPISPTSTHQSATRERQDSVQGEHEGRT